MEQIKELDEKTVRAICHDNIVLTELRGVLYHDYYTFVHSGRRAADHAPGSDDRIPKALSSTRNSLE